MGYTYYEPLNVWLDPASIPDVVAHIQEYLTEYPLINQSDIEQIVVDYITAHPELVGGVDSVNGKTGEVVLTASDINTSNNTTIQAVINSLSADISAIVQSVTTLSGRVTANETGITNEATARANADTALGNRITALQGAVGSPLVAATAAAMTDTSKIYVYTGSESGYTNGNWYYYNGSAWTSGGVYNATAINTDTTLTVAGMAADAKATGDGLNDLKSSLGDTSAFSETLGYIPPSFTNSDFVPGMYANGSWRGDGNYAKCRTIHELIPLDDFVVTAETNDYSNLVLTLQLWDSSNAYIGSYRVGGSNGTPISMSTVIQNGSYEILKSEALNTNASAAYITVSIGKLVSGAWVDLPTDLVLELRKTVGAENVLSKIAGIQTAINNSGELIQLSDLQTFAWGKHLTSTGELSNASAHKVVFTKIKNVKRIAVNLAQNSGAIIGIIRDSEDNIVATLQRIFYYGEPYQFDVSLNTEEEYTLYLNFFSYATVPNPYYDRITLYYSNPVDYAKPEVIKIARDTAVMLPHHSVFKPFDFNGKTAAFFGDSITVGVINGDGTQVTTNNYPNVFSAKVGLTPTNKAVSGSRIYVPDGVQAAKILSQLQSVTLSDYDFIFIAGGINDFVSYTVDQMLIGLTELISYVKSNFTGDVIWITPINTARNVTDNYNNKKDLNDYISAMTKLIKESDSNYQFSVVQGWEFGFPTLDSDSAFKNAMFGDGELHPSELGYNTLYVPGLLTALC